MDIFFKKQIGIKILIFKPKKIVIFQTIIFSENLYIESLSYLQKLKNKIFLQLVFEIFMT